MEAIIRQFLPDGIILRAEILAGGLIHQTYKVNVEINGRLEVFVLQSLNTKTFKNPPAIMKNLSLVLDFLKQQKAYRLALPIPLRTIHSKLLYQDQEGHYWRMFPFIKNSVSYELPPTKAHLYEAGKAYAQFLAALKDFDPQQLSITIPNFHHLADRFRFFKKVIETAENDRKRKANIAIEQTLAFYTKYPLDFSHLPIRAVHNDSKLSNLLFDKNTETCLAVIDLDTLMPGYIVTDFGDMVRGMCNTATEDEPDMSKVGFSTERFDALRTGFLEQSQDWLSDEEQAELTNGAIYIILEQAIRFLTDYLNEDVYYGAKYPEHNHDRARNQLQLLTSLEKHIKII